MQYAIESGALQANPIKAIKWTRPRTLKTVDSRTVVNSDVADWAGHSVDVLLRVYTKCISGQQHEAMRRIEEATRPRDHE
jgi:hypothetical protein